MATDFLALLKDNGALLEGHFELTSGRHSDRYIEKFRLLEQPEALDAAATALIDGVSPEEVDVVLGAAVGGILLAGAVARLLGRRIIFTERVGGRMVFRRGFALEAGERVLVVDDIVTTGGSIRELLAVVRAARAEIQSVVCLVDRNEKDIDMGGPKRALLRLPLANWAPAACPLCREGVPLQKPGGPGNEDAQGPAD